MPLGGAAIIGGASLASGVIGGILSSGAMEDASQAAMDALKRAQAIVASTPMPPDLAGSVILDQFKQAGVLTPQLEQAINVATSQVSKLQEDPQVRQFQVQALQNMAQMGRAGLTPDERAQLRDLQLQAAKAGQAQQASIIQNMQARGQAGSGAELAARLGASQASANQMSTAADQASSMAAQRALQAIASSGGMASQLRGQDFQAAMAKAQAQDELNRFNVQNQIAQQARNVAAGNQAQASNLALAQQIGNANVTQQNQLQYWNAQMREQNWRDQLMRNQAIAAPGSQQAGLAMQAGQQQAQALGSMFGGISSAIGQGGNFYMQNQMLNAMNARNAPQTAGVAPEMSGGYAAPANYNVGAGAGMDASQLGTGINFNPSGYP